jgi:NAD(P)H-nitrite reductase large subunit
MTSYSEHSSAISGGRKKTTPRDEQVLFRSVKRNRRQTLKDLTARFNNRTGYNVSERTVRRILPSIATKVPTP